MPPKPGLRILIFDESLELIRRAQSVFASCEVKLTFAGSVAELELAIERFGPHDLLIINDLSTELSVWMVADRLRRMRAQGRIVALFDDPSDSRARAMKDLLRVECLRRPNAEPLLDNLLGRLAAESMRPRNDVIDVAGEIPMHHGIVGHSKKLQQIFGLIDKVASGDASVCIYGESGTGKELIARALHNASPRAPRPLVTLDCTAIPEGLMESQLFGHVRGAFTGAVDNRDGVFSLAHTGTLFMDELGELNLPLQAKLLRVIQSREFCKVGGSRPITTNIRLITASNRDLLQAVERGTFREDLYYRLAVIMIEVPPLRQRREDIPLLVEYFLRKFSAIYRKDSREVAPAAMDRIIASPWPGNVRQLQNFIEQAVVLADREVLRERDLFLADQPPKGRGLTLKTGDIEAGLPLREVERRYILGTLGRLHGSRTQAAKILGISLRTLQYKLKTYAIEGDGIDETEITPGRILTPGRRLPREQHS